MPFEITASSDFSASHQLRLQDGTLEPLHGHNWRVKIVVGADHLDSMGVVMDFHALDAKLAAILAPMHHSHLNDLPPFSKTNPSAENVAVHVAKAIELPKNIKLLSVEVWETLQFSAIYRP
jgi:6-pyruvoyltetrahydropterin/6-carboxytetrahydropterin synthase